jgi:hypothetical protein
MKVGFGLAIGVWFCFRKVVIDLGCGAGIATVVSGPTGLILPLSAH